MCRTNKILYAKDAQRLSGHFKHHSATIELVFTDLGPGEVQFSTKIAEISTLLTTPKLADFCFWWNNSLQSCGGALPAPRLKCAYFQRVRPFPWWLWGHHRRYIDRPGGPERSVFHQNCGRELYFTKGGQQGRNFHNFGGKPTFPGPQVSQYTFSDAPNAIKGKVWLFGSKRTSTWELAVYHRNSEGNYFTKGENQVVLGWSTR